MWLYICYKIPAKRKRQKVLVLFSFCWDDVQKCRCEMILWNSFIIWFDFILCVKKVWPLWNCRLVLTVVVLGLFCPTRFATMTLPLHAHTPPSPCSHLAAHQSPSSLASLRCWWDKLVCKSHVDEHLHFLLLLLLAYYFYNNYHHRSSHLRYTYCLFRFLNTLTFEQSTQE